jgi:small subunit ribosomal protein S6e
MEIKVNIGDPKTGKTYKKTVAEDDAKIFFGKKLGDSIKGELLQAPGYEFTLVGGSDYCGFPMRRDVEGTLRKRVLIVEGVGLRANREGRRVRKAVAGNTVYARTAQMNLKVMKHGAQPLEAAAESGEAKAEE